MKVELFGWTIHIFRHRLSGRERHKIWRLKCIKNSLCVICGRKVVDISYYTGEKYRKCKIHRKVENYLSKLRRQKFTK